MKYKPVLERENSPTKRLTTIADLQERTESKNKGVFLSRSQFKPSFICSGQFLHVVWEVRKQVYFSSFAFSLNIQATLWAGI